MYRKLPILELVLALSIPAFPLGALLFISRNSVPLPEEEIPGPALIREFLPGPPEEAVPRGSPGHPVLAFYPRIAGETLKETPQAEPKTPDQGETAPGPVFTGDTFKYLGLVEETDGREQLYLKDTQTGRIIAMSPESYALSIEGEKYIARRN
jgi:hypothetical protein